MDYNTLCGSKGTPGSLADWVSSSIIQNDVPFIIEEAQSNIYRTLRHWQMMPPPDLAVATAGSDSITYPADMLEPDVIWLQPTIGTSVLTGSSIQTGQMEVIQRTMQDVLRSWSYYQPTSTTFARTPQTPTMFYFDNTAIHFDSPCDIAYNYALVYYQQPAALSSTNPTNFLTARYQRLMRVALMLGACEWLKEAGQGTFDRTYWQQEFQLEIDKAQKESDRARRGTLAGPIYVGGGGNAQDAYGWGYRA